MNDLKLLERNRKSDVFVNITNDFLEFFLNNRFLSKCTITEQSFREKTNEINEKWTKILRTDKINVLTIEKKEHAYLSLFIAHCINITVYTTFV